MAKIWKPDLTNILPGAQIGENTSIGAFCEIGKDVIIGESCKIQYGVFIPKGVTIGNRVFLGPGVRFTNDRYPSAIDYGKFEQTIVEDDVAIGAGSNILCGITLGKGCKIGMGSNVLNDVVPGTSIAGNPAKEI